MGKRVEWDMGWMEDVAEVLQINYRPKSEHTVEYEDRAGNYCTVRVPACFISFLEKVGHSKSRWSERAA